MKNSFGPVLQHDAVFDGERRAFVERTLEGVSHPVAISGMHATIERRCRHLGIVRSVTEQAMTLGRPSNRILLRIVGQGIRFPTADAGDTLRREQVGLTLQQFLFGSLAFSDVAAS